MTSSTRHVAAVLMGVIEIVTICSPAASRRLGRAIRGESFQPLPFDAIVFVTIERVPGLVVFHASTFTRSVAPATPGSR